MLQHQRNLHDAVGDIISTHLEASWASQRRNSDPAEGFLAPVAAVDVVADLPGGAVVQVLAALVNVDAVDQEEAET